MCGIPVTRHNFFKSYPSGGKSYLCYVFRLQNHLFMARSQMPIHKSNMKIYFVILSLNLSYLKIIAQDKKENKITFVYLMIRDLSWIVIIWRIKITRNLITPKVPPPQQIQDCLSVLKDLSFNPQLPCFIIFHLTLTLYQILGDGLVPLIIDIINLNQQLTSRRWDWN